MLTFVIFLSLFLTGMVCMIFSLSIVIDIAVPPKRYPESGFDAGVLFTLGLLCLAVALHLTGVV